MASILVTSFVSAEIQYCPKLGAVLRIQNKAYVGALYITLYCEFFYNVLCAYARFCALCLCWAC
jgi:hypothetical protein